MQKEVSGKVEKFFSQFKLRKYAKGQVLILNGDESEYVYHLEKGRVKQYDVTYRGDEIILNIFKPSAFFPMSLVINKTTSPYIYETDTEVELRQAPADDVVAFMHTNPDVVYDLLSRVYHGTDGLLGRMTYLMASSAESRLIYELIIEARRFGKAKKDGSCMLLVSEKDLGARAGLSRETVSREIAKLKSENLIKLDVKNIQITNMSALEKKLGQEV